MTENRIESVEIRLAYQDQMLHELNEVLTDQQARIMQLEKRVDSLLERVKSLSDGSSGDPENERPPHY